MLENVYEGLNAPSKVNLSKVYFLEMYPFCVSSIALRVYSHAFRNQKDEPGSFRN